MKSRHRVPRKLLSPKSLLRRARLVCWRLRCSCSPVAARVRAFDANSVSSSCSSTSSTDVTNTFVWERPVCFHDRLQRDAEFRRCLGDSFGRENFRIADQFAWVRWADSFVWAAELPPAVRAEVAVNIVAAVVVADRIVIAIELDSNYLHLVFVFCTSWAPRWMRSTCSVQFFRPNCRYSRTKTTWTDFGEDFFYKTQLLVKGDQFCLNIKNTQKSKINLDNIFYRSNSSSDSLIYLFIWQKINFKLNLKAFLMLTEKIIWKIYFNKTEFFWINSNFWIFFMYLFFY